MKILVVEPMKEPYAKEIQGTLEEMQAIVGGYIQAVYPFEDPVAVVCNDEGKLMGLPYNRLLRDDSGRPYDVLCGTFFVRVWARRISLLCRTGLWRNTKQCTARKCFCRFRKKNRQERSAGRSDSIAIYNFQYGISCSLFAASY